MIVYDPADPRWSTDPGPLFDEIRENNPVHRSPDGFWVLSRHEDVLGILRHKSSSADSLNADSTQQSDRLGSPDRDAQRELIRTSGEDNRPFLFRDPPDHERLRGLVQRAFTPRRIMELKPFVTTLARAMVAQHCNGEPFNAVQELAWPLPVAVICEMLAIPASDHESFQAKSALLARGLDPEFLLSEADRRDRDDALLHFIGYFSGLFAERRQRPGDDLLTAMVQAKDGEDQLTEGELLSTAILLLVAGHETTMNLISGSLLALSRDRVAQDRLRATGVDRAAVDELLRMVSPVQLTVRVMLDDVELGEHVLEKGSSVMLLIGAANRDPAVFANPTELDLARDPNPQLGFGFGLHHCLGSPLARLEAQVLLEELLAATSSFEVTGPVHYRPNIVLRGLAELDVVLQP